MSQLPTHKEAHLRYPPGPRGSAGQNKTCLGLLIPRLPRREEGVSSGDSREVSPSAALGKGTRRAPGAVGQIPPPGHRGQVPAGREPARGRERTHLGEEVVHCSSAFPDWPASGVQLQEVSPAEGPGKKPCMSRRDSQELKP